VTVKVSPYAETRERWASSLLDERDEVPAVVDRVVDGVMVSSTR